MSENAAVTNHQNPILHFIILENRELIPPVPLYSPSTRKAAIRGPYAGKVFSHKGKGVIIPNFDRINKHDIDQEMAKAKIK